ncbi:antitoxin CptB [Kushneria sinocarnis]|uniref:FAD assembly factor SdhE n=1 Tax=Kushneria sinocarnis TaxID=595502 RepID=A0A420WV83_9GAMM|nr:succinate dehydrogenase assembly factor 2 [Kushneria sinocarnis]RKR02459.1 antitoxin CptB [Kushneria sinocarnis]
MDDTARKRLYWHSRRGMWELDLMLLPFFENCFAQLDDARQQAYADLLAEQDQDLFSWLMRRGRPMDDALAAMVDEIIAYAERTRTAEVRPV